MRNLKKILSLALALVMVFSLMTFASARDFGDADSVDHTEAANVLNALGIVEGYEDGNFYPDRVVKRGEMAKMIAFIVNGGKDPVLNPAEVSYNDTANHWAKGYIEYCTGLGIVSGYGDGSFKPDNTVTGTEAAKMLLIAMGYNSDIREYTGPSWSLNVGVDANQKDLYKDLTYVNPSNGLDRDATAQMVYNCLNAKGVYRSDSIGVQDGKVTYNYTDDIYTVLYRKMGVARVEGVVVGNEYADLTDNGAAKTHEQAGKTAVVVTNYDELKNVGGVGANTILNVTNNTSFTPGTTPSAFPTDTFAVSSGKDELGKAVILFARPASNTKSPEKATVIGSVVLDENTVMTRTESWTKQSKIDDALRAAGLKVALPGCYYINGSASTNSYTYANAVSGNVNRSGYRTQFIDFDLDGTVDFVLVDKVDFGKVTIKSTKSAGSMTIATGDGTPNVKKDDSKDIIGFDDVAQGDYVLYAEVGDRLYVEKPETVTGKLTDYSKQGDTSTTDGGDSALWVDGTKIKNSGATGWDCDGSKLSNPKTYGSGGLDKDATYYLDACGYIVAVDGAGAQKFALATYYNADAYNEGGITTSARAQVTFEDGTSSAPKVDSATKSVLNTLGTSGNLAANAVLGRYTYNSSDELVLTVPAKNGIANTGTFKYVSGNILVSSNGSNLQASGKNLYMTSNTVVFFVETEDNGAIGSKKVDKVTTYTGKDSTPGIELDTDYVVKYVYNDDNEILAMAVISGSISAVADNYLYLIKIDRTGTKTKTGLAVIDGEVRDVVIDSGSEATVTAGKAYEYSTSSNGALKLKDISASKLAGQFTVEQVNTNDNTVVVNGVEYKVTSKTTIANLDDEETLSLSGLNKGDIVTVLFDTSGSDKTALGIYIHETVDPSSASLAQVILGTAGGAAGTIVSSTVDSDKTHWSNQNSKAHYDIQVNTSITGDELKAALVIPEGASVVIASAFDGTTHVSGALATDGTVYYAVVTSKDGSTKSNYEFKATVYTPPAPAPIEVNASDLADTAALTAKITEAKNAGKKLVVTGNVTLDTDLSIPTGAEVEIKGDVAANATEKVTVVGKLTVTNGDLVEAVVDGGEITVTGTGKAVTKLTATANGGTVTGKVTELADVSGDMDKTDDDVKLTVDGTIVGITAVTHDAKIVATSITNITAIGAATKTVKVDAPVTGTVDVKNGTVSFEKPITGSVTVTDGTSVTFKDTVATVTNIVTATAVEFQKAVTTVTKITAGTVTFSADGNTVVEVAGGTVNVNGDTTVKPTTGITPLGTCAIAVKGGKTLTLDAENLGMTLANVTLTGEASAKIVTANNGTNKITGASKVYDGTGATGVSGDIDEDASFTYDGTASKFKQDP